MSAPNVEPLVEGEQKHAFVWSTAYVCRFYRVGRKVAISIDEAAKVTASCWLDRGEDYGMVERCVEYVAANPLLVDARVEQLERAKHPISERSILDDQRTLWAAWRKPEDKYLIRPRHWYRQSQYVDYWERAVSAMSETADGRV